MEGNSTSGPKAASTAQSASFKQKGTGKGRGGTTEPRAKSAAPIEDTSLTYGLRMDSEGNHELTRFNPLTGETEAVGVDPSTFFDPLPEPEEIEPLSVVSANLPGMGCDDHGVPSILPRPGLDEEDEDEENDDDNGGDDDGDEEDRDGFSNNYSFSCLPLVSFRIKNPANFKFTTLLNNKLTTFLTNNFQHNNKFPQEPTSQPFPFLEDTADGQLLHTADYVVPLGQATRFCLLQHPETGSYYIDDELQGPNVKPRYVSTLEKRKAAIPRLQPFSSITGLVAYWTLVRPT